MNVYCVNIGFVYSWIKDTHGALTVDTYGVLRVDTFWKLHNLNDTEEKFNMYFNRVYKWY